MTMIGANDDDDDDGNDSLRQYNHTHTMTMINGKNAPNTLYLMCGMDHLGMKMCTMLGIFFSFYFLSFSVHSFVLFEGMSRIVEEQQQKITDGKAKSE